MNAALVTDFGKDSYYILCNELRRLALRMQQAIGNVEDISVNASIVASQTGTQARVFFEISSQVEKTSRKMHSQIALLLNAINKLIECVLSSKIDQQRMEHFAQAKISPRHPSNQRLVECIQNQYKIYTNIKQRQVIHCVNAIESHFSLFEFLINRIFVALTALRVEEQLFKNQLKLVAVGSLIKSFEKLLAHLSEDYDAFRDFFMLFKGMNTEQ